MSTYLMQSHGFSLFAWVQKTNLGEGLALVNFVLRDTQRVFAVQFLPSMTT